MKHLDKCISERCADNDAIADKEITVVVHKHWINECAL
jgi:hypothetical protein